MRFEEWYRRMMERDFGDTPDAALQAENKNRALKSPVDRVTVSKP